MRATRIDPKKASALLLLIIQFIFSIILLGHRGCAPSLDSDKQIASVAPTDAIFVHVVGNVRLPGVYKFPASSSPTRQDAVAAAGGSINPNSPIDLTAPVHDEERIVIE